MPAVIVGSPSFRERLRNIRQFLVGIEAVCVYLPLLIDLEETVFPNLAMFPLIGKPWHDGKVHSTEALMAMARLPPDADKKLRQYIHGDFTLLYAVSADAVHLVSIRHHREASFNP